MFMRAVFMLTLWIVQLQVLCSAAKLAGDKIKLHILPHTHADVGWLETVDALARMNVSRILDGVTGNCE